MSLTVDRKGKYRTANRIRATPPQAIASVDCIIKITEICFSYKKSGEKLDLHDKYGSMVYKIRFSLVRITQRTLSIPSFIFRPILV